VKKQKSHWVEAFGKAKHGHTLWDGRAANPHDPIHAYDGAKQFVDFAKFHGMFGNGNRILDLGCGNGRFCILFSEMPVEYFGLDPMKEQIDFCRETFSGWPHLRFSQIDVRNEVFHPTGAFSAEEYRLPFSDRHFDDIVAYSVFTHLQNLPAAKNYMAEIKRCLKPGGRLFTTWYRSPPDTKPDQYVGRTVYNEWDILTMLSGLEFLFSYGGHDRNDYYDQWGIFCRKPLKA
jgi:SAM-dependent methyltransferase